eukprot:gene19273-21199_t
MEWATSNACDDDENFDEYGSDSKYTGKDGDEDTNDENGNDESGDRDNHNEDQNSDGEELEFIVYNGQIIDYENAPSTLRWAINNADEVDADVKEYEMYCEGCEGEYENDYDDDVSQSESGENRERSSLAESVVYKEDNEEDISECEICNNFESSG